MKTGERILIAEDAQSVQRLLEHYLGLHPDAPFDITAAATAESAKRAIQIATMQGWLFRVAFLDRQLPLTDAPGDSPTSDASTEILLALHVAERDVQAGNPGQPITPTDVVYIGSDSLHAQGMNITDATVAPGTLYDMRKPGITPAKLNPIIDSIS